MPRYYLETSALVKKYRTERGTEVVAELFEGQLESEVLVTSYLTVVEVTSVATRLFHAGALSRRAYRVILGNLSRDVGETIQLQSVSDVILSDAVALAENYALRAPDAIHLSTARRVRGAFPDEPYYVVGSDARLKAACEGLGLVVLDPEAPDSLAVLKSYRGQG